MKNSKFTIIASSLLLLVGVVHSIRLLGGWEVYVNTVAIPVWLSWSAALLAFSLSFFGFEILKKNKK